MLDVLTPMWRKLQNHAGSAGSTYRLSTGWCPGALAVGKDGGQSKSALKDLLIPRTGYDTGRLAHRDGPVLASGDLPSTLIACQEQGTVRTNVPKVHQLCANQAVLDFTGLTLEDVQAEDFPAKVFHPNDLERVRGSR